MPAETPLLRTWRLAVSLVFVTQGSLVARWEVAPLPHYMGLCTLLLVAMGVLVAACGTLFALGHHVQRPEDRPAPATAPVTEPP